VFLSFLIFAIYATIFLGFLLEHLFLKLSLSVIAMHLVFFTARCYAERGHATVSCLSICLSVTFRYRDHIGWNNSKIISRPNSLRLVRRLTPTWAIWCNGNTPKNRMERPIYIAHGAVTFAIARNLVSLLFSLFSSVVSGTFSFSLTRKHRPAFHSDWDSRAYFASKSKFICRSFNIR